MKRVLKNNLLILFGGCISAFGTACLLLPNKLSTGGFSGIATVLFYLLNVRVGTIIILLNIPLFIWSFIKLGRKFLFKTIISTIIYSKMIDFFGFINVGIKDVFLASIYGGILVGVGLAIILREGASTGGTDLIANIIQKYNSQIKIGQVIIVLDFIIVGINMIVFQNLEIGLYSFIAIYLSGKMIDLVIEGINFSKMVYIISDKHHEISKMINKELQRGATLIYGKGSYTENNKIIIMCAVKRSNIIKIKSIIKNIDDKAFIIITDAVEVYGLGFR